MHAVYLCVYAYVVCMYVSMHHEPSIHVVYILINIYVCMLVCVFDVCVFVFLCVYVCVRARVCLFICVRVCVRARVYVYEFTEFETNEKLSKFL